ncbi:hypothetical protein ACB098_11G184900 [Castanea mollissima]
MVVTLHSTITKSSNFHSEKSTHCLSKFTSFDNHFLSSKHHGWGPGEYLEVQICNELLCHSIIGHKIKSMCLIMKFIHAYRFIPHCFLHDLLATHYFSLLNQL